MLRKSLTVQEKIIIAAYSLESKGKKPFTAEDLVVESWNKFPDAFSLKGYNYPDSNRVYAEIMGSKPLRKNGYLAKSGEKRYALTTSGKQLASIIHNKLQGIDAKKANLVREIIDNIQKLFKSKAFLKHISDKDRDLTFLDACTFWGITPRSDSNELQNKHADLMQILNTAKKAVENGPISTTHGGKTFSNLEIKLLIETHELLLQKFSNDLDLIRGRNTRKKTK